MLGLRLANRRVLGWLPMILWSGGLNAQTCLVLSLPTLGANGTAKLDLSLFSARGKEPAAIQWTFQYEPSSIKTLTINDGPALTAAGKTAVCFGDGSAHNCLAVGTNTKPIGNGIIAQLAAVLAPGTAMPTILMKSPLAASAGGLLVPVLPKVVTDPNEDPFSDCRPPLQWRAPAGK